METQNTNTETNEQVTIKHLGKDISLEQFNKIHAKQLAKELNIEVEQVKEIRQATEYLTQDSVKAVDMLNIKPVTIETKKTRVRTSAPIHKIAEHLNTLEDGATFTKKECIDVASADYFGDLPTLEEFNNATAIGQMVFAKQSNLSVEELKTKIQKKYLSLVKRVNSALANNGDAGCIRNNSRYSADLQFDKTSQGVYVVVKQSNQKFAELKSDADKATAKRAKQIEDAKAKTETKS